MHLAIQEDKQIPGNLENHQRKKTHCKQKCTDLNDKLFSWETMEGSQRRVQHTFQVRKEESSPLSSRYSTGCQHPMSKTGEWAGLPPHTNIPELRILGTLDLSTSIYTTTSIPTESSWSPCISPKLQQQLLDDSLCPRLACKLFIPGSKNTDHVTILQKSLNDSLWHLT